MRSMADPDYVYRPQSTETIRLRRSAMLDVIDRKRGIQIPSLTRLSYREEVRANKARMDALHRAPGNLWNAGIYVPERKITRENRVVLAYPYIIQRRDEHTDLLAVNALVPQMPGREDVCQEIMLALWEKKVTVDQIKANRADLRAFIRAFSKENYEAGGYARSLDEPLPDGRSRYDVLSEADGLWR